MFATEGTIDPGQCAPAKRYNRRTPRRRQTEGVRRKRASKGQLSELSPSVACFRLGLHPTSELARSEPAWPEHGATSSTASARDFKFFQARKKGVVLPVMLSPLFLCDPTQSDEAADFDAGARACSSKSVLRPEFSTVWESSDSSAERRCTIERSEIGADLFEAALQLRRIAMSNSTKMIFTVVALCVGLTAPAFAKDQTAIRDAQAVHPVVHVYAIDYYEAHHGASRINPDRQGSGYRDWAIREPLKTGDWPRSGGAFFRPSPRQAREMLMPLGVAGDVAAARPDSTMLVMKFLHAFSFSVTGFTYAAGAKA
jgi:hypothetical protein